MVCVRPLRVLSAFVSGLGIATAPGSTTDAAGQWFYWCLGAAFLLAAFLLVAWQFRAQVIADGGGLRWRDLGRWRRAAWAQVSDYYEKPLPRGQRLIIQTSIGTIKLSVQGWSDLKRLRDAVERHATRATAKSWGTLGTRPEERWPLVFEYNRVDTRSMRVMGL
jgi:hypothetical protein